MRVKVGDHARHKDNSKIGWAKVIEIIPPRTSINKHGYQIAKVEWTTEKNAKIGLIKHFAVRNLVKAD